jgi:hypothetical protein
MMMAAKVRIPGLRVTAPPDRSVIPSLLSRVDSLIVCC